MSDTESTSTDVQENKIEQTLDLPVVVDKDETEFDSSANVSNMQSINNGPKACEDPRYKQFFKMVQFGVPPQAVKLKMESEGIDSTILE